MKTLSSVKRIIFFLLLFLNLWLQANAEKKVTSKQNTEYKPHSFNFHLALGNLNIVGDVHSKSIWSQTKHWSLTRGLSFGTQYLLDKKHIYAETGFMAGTASGYNYTPSTAYLQGGPDNPWVQAGYTEGVYNNYATKLRALNVGAVYSTDKRKRLSAEAGLSMSAVVFSTWIDARNSRGNRYDYAFAIISDKHGINQNNQKAIQTDLLNLFDGDYESPAEGYGNKEPANSLIPALSVKLGFEIKLVPELSMGIKNKIMFTGNDLLDGQKWQERSGETIGNDAINFLSIEIKYHLF